MSATTALAESANDANASGNIAEAPVTDVNMQAAVGSAADLAVATETPAAAKPEEAVPTTDAKGRAGPGKPGSHEAAERVRQSKLLPPALKERLAALVEASAAGPVEEAVRAVEEALPDFWLGQRSRGEQPEHPDGDGFFSGDPRELSDAEAERIAREQLARSGLLRGQRARVAD